MPDLRSILQDVGTECNRLLTDIILGRVSEDDISEDTKDTLVGFGVDALSYLRTARNDIADAEEIRAEERMERGREFDANWAAGE